MQRSSSACVSDLSTLNTAGSSARFNSGLCGYSPCRKASTCPRDKNGEGSDTPGSGAFLSRRCGYGTRRVCNDTTLHYRNESRGCYVTYVNTCMTVSDE